MSGVTSQERQTWSARYIYRCARETPPADGLVRETRPGPVERGAAASAQQGMDLILFLATRDTCTLHDQWLQKKGGTLGPQS